MSTVEESGFEEEPSSDILPMRVAELRSTEVALNVVSPTTLRILCVSLGRAQGALQLATVKGNASVTCWFLDAYRERLAAESLAIVGKPVNLTTICQADFPDELFDLAIVPCSQQGEAELTRDLLQSAYQRLRTGGRLIAAVDNPRDKWLGEQLKHFGVAIERINFADAVVYCLTNSQPLKRVRSFTCSFKFRDGDQLVNAVSRPGVFSHRHIDPGARRLLEHAVIRDGDKVLDLGCGCGTVGIALALRGNNMRIHAVDSNARAIECVSLGAAQNNVADRVSTELNSDGVATERDFDWVIANPPYYADFRIAEHFVMTAATVIKPNGNLLIVTKNSEWYEDRLTRYWKHASTNVAKGYAVVRFTRKV